MLTWLRIIVSCFCLVLCVLCAALWVRSYIACDVAARVSRYALATAANYKGSIDGTVEVSPEMFPRQMHAEYHLSYGSPMRDQLERRNGFFGFYWSRSETDNSRSWQYCFPLWPFVIIFALTSVVTRPRPRFQFELRDLWILLSVLALMLGTIFSMFRGDF
jgi:hypothetical protein